MSLSLASSCSCSSSGSRCAQPTYGRCARDIFGLGTRRSRPAPNCCRASAWRSASRRWPRFILSTGFVLTSTAIVMQILDERGDMARRAASTPSRSSCWKISPSFRSSRWCRFCRRGDEPSFQMRPPVWQVASRSARWPGGLPRALAAQSAVPASRAVGRARSHDRCGAAGRARRRHPSCSPADCRWRWARFWPASCSPNRIPPPAQADIEPFRGILLGLFFLGVGMSLDLEVVA